MTRIRRNTRASHADYARSRKPPAELELGQKLRDPEEAKAEQERNDKRQAEAQKAKPSINALASKGQARKDSLTVDTAEIVGAELSVAKPALLWGDSKQGGYQKGDPKVKGGKRRDPLTKKRPLPTPLRESQRKATRVKAKQTQTTLTSPKG